MIRKYYNNFDIWPRYFLPTLIYSKLIDSELKTRYPDHYRYIKDRTDLLFLTQPASVKLLSAEYCM